MAPLCPTQGLALCTDALNGWAITPVQVDIIFGAVEGLKTLQCCGESSLPEQRSTLRAINTLNPPQKYISKLGRLSSIYLKRQRGAQGLMWGAQGPNPPAAAMVVAVVMPVVFSAKATEKRNKNTKISWWLPKKWFISIYCKTYCNSYIANCSVAWAQVH